MPRDLYDSKGKSVEKLARNASFLRKQFEIDSDDNVDIISVLEFKLPVLIPEFHLKIVSDEEIDSDALANISPPAIVVRKSVYLAAVDGDRRCRFVLAHELAHIVLHRRFENETLHHTQGLYSENIRDLNAMTSSEAQATIFARFFMISPRTARAFKGERAKLAKITGMPEREAASAITISKRQEMLSV